MLARVCERFVVEPHDLVARYGGEEFVLLLPGRSLNAAIAQAEALRRAVAQEAFAHPASPLAPHMTISMGVAALVPTADTSPEQLVAAADRAMYAAKAAGRDRVAWGAMARRA
jgi:diguanylate cyclase (GGDEF)-like protein